MDWHFPYTSIRRPLLAANCVATTQPLAAQAGLAMLVRGGNAVDAAVATAITLAVVEPVMNGIGGDAFAIVWTGKELVGLNASGRAPKSWTIDRFRGHGMPSAGWDTVTVPGAVSAWVALHERFGTLPFGALFELALSYAEEGVPVAPTIAEIWQRQVERLRDQPGFSDAFLPKGRAPGAGEVFRCPDQARTLAAIAESGGESFYRGTIAETIVRAAEKAGAGLSLEDLAEHEADWVKPIRVRYKGYDIHELPPNGQGIGALIALGILDRLDTNGLDPDSAEIQHLRIEATKIGLANVRAHVADPEAMRVDVEEMLDVSYFERAAHAIRRDSVGAPAPVRGAEGGTVYLATSDASGMAVSYIQSNYHGFGSGVVIPNTGIALHNRGCGFVTDPAHPNCVGPGKRPLNTIIPGFITQHDSAVGPFGVMGGNMQAQGHVQVVSRMLDADQNPQAAIDAPRWRVEGDEVWVEAAVPEATREGLRRRGHRLVEAVSLDFGASQILRRNDRFWIAGSESRRDGFAVGF